MFVKHSFGVKYQPEISPSVTPQEQDRTMTAALSYLPDGYLPDSYLSEDLPTIGRLAPEVYRARRLAVLSLAFAVAVGSLVGVASFGNQAAASRGDQLDSSNSISVTVMPGDTLWGIAERLDPGSDPRPLVHELSALAGKGVLQPGQVLQIPNSLID